MKCIGYDENGQQFDCPNEAGTPWTAMWCLPCDEIRRARIDNQLQGLLDHLERQRRK